ncbi:MAG: hypothetical protein ABIO70_26595 [Pseudomonadota bacterium]
MSHARTRALLLVLPLALLAPAAAMAASDRARVEAALTETARKAGWPAIPFVAGGMGSGALGVSATGSDGEVDKAVVGYDDAHRAWLMLDTLETNGLPRVEFHGKPGIRIANGRRICDAGGTVGYILKLVRWVVHLFAPGVDDRLLCAEATGTVAWQCGADVFVVNSPDANDDSARVAEFLYAAAERQGLCAREIAWNRVAAKLAKKQRLTSCEFLVYVKKVEQINPDMGWQQLTTALHQGIYAADTKLNFFGVDLFVDGKDNAGWEKANLPYGSPKWIESSGGSVIDIGHSYAGLRAVLNRNQASSYFMSRVNTQWGDQTQVIQDKVEGAAGRAWGNAEWAWNQIPLVGSDEGEKAANERIMKAKIQYQNAQNNLPPDQERGNAGGLYLRSWFISNPTGTLSDAYRAWFTSLGEKC